MFLIVGHSADAMRIRLMQ